MYFTRPDQVFAAGHESAGVTAPQTRWFLAEGATGSFFNMFILLANPSTDAADVRCDYLLTNGQTITRTHTVGAGSRLTLNVGAWRRRSSPRRTCRRWSRRPTACRSSSSARCGGRRRRNWQEAHNSPGEIVTGTRWAVAEGESGGRAARRPTADRQHLDLRRHRARDAVFEDGTTAEKLFSLPASSRTNVSVNVEFPAAAERRYGALIETQGATPAADRRRARDVRERQRHHLGRRHQRAGDQAAYRSCSDGPDGLRRVAGARRAPAPA